MPDVTSHELWIQWSIIQIIILFCLLWENTRFHGNVWWTNAFEYIERDNTWDHWDVTGISKLPSDNMLIGGHAACYCSAFHNPNRNRWALIESILST